MREWRERPDDEPDLRQAEAEERIYIHALALLHKHANAKGRPFRDCLEEAVNDFLNKHACGPACAEPETSTRKDPS